MMKLEFIEQLIKLAERFSVAELEYAEGSSRVRFSLLVEGQALSPVTIASPQAAVAPSTASVQPAAAPDSDTRALTSSLSGVFYRSQAPGEPAFVQVGDVVTEGQTLAIIEAMKMLNPIEADRGGRVSAILYQDGDLVESGAPLFMLESEV